MAFIFFFFLVVHTRSLVIPVGTKLEFCTAQGNKYQLGQAFTFTDKCFLFNCECYQDGSWECPSEKSQYTCPLNPGKKIVRSTYRNVYTCKFFLVVLFQENMKNVMVSDELCG